MVTESMAESSETMVGRSSDIDATIGGDADGADRTFVVEPIRRHDVFRFPVSTDDGEAAVDKSADPDATLGPGDLRSESLGLDELLAPPPVAAAPIGQPARVVAGPDRRIRTASVACGQLLGTAPDRLIGLTLEELFAKSLHLVEKGDGPAAVSFMLERSSSDQTVSLIITAGQATEPLS